MNSYHEVEIITLSSPRVLPRKDLHIVLADIGFKSEDDFYHLQRRGNLPVWQTSTLLNICVRLRGNDVYETEDDVIEGTAGSWDSLLVKYFMATVPRECIRLAIDILFVISEKFQLEVNYCGKPQNKSDLIQSLENIANDLTANLDAPGSEVLAILVEQSHSK